MSDDLVAFLNARLDEDEPPEICGCLDANHWPPCAPQPAADRLRREVAAKRAMVEKYRLGRQLWNPDTGDWFSPAAVMFGSDMEWLIRTLAAVYSGHPDYRAEWKP